MLVVKMPFSYRMTRAAFFSIDNNMEEAAKSMGGVNLLYHDAGDYSILATGAHVSNGAQFLILC